MRKLFLIGAIVLLLINGMGALYGGIQFIIEPSGGKIGMPMEWPQNSH